MNDVGMMPDAFVHEYEVLWLDTFGVAGGGSRPEKMGRVGARRVVRVSSSQTETRGGAHGSGSVGMPADVVRNDAAFRVKQRVDRKLRTLARDIRRWRVEEVERAGVRKCGKCNRWAEADWSYCPFDGFRTQEVS